MTSISDRPGRWERIGRILAGPGDVGWAISHAALPFAEVREDGRVRVHFCARDRTNCARIGYVDVDPERWTTAGPVSPTRVLDLSPRGAFDDHGVTSAWIVTHEGRRYHYFTGWTLGQTVPFYFFVGLAIGNDDESGPRRVSPAPILDRSAIDPYLTASPCVLVEGGCWRMWYVSGVGWKVESDPPQPIYHIKYAESADGIAWDRRGVVCIDFAAPDEHAIARPWVVRDADRYRMWFCCRGPAYRIGYAESPDGIVWNRRDDAAGLDASASGWDSEMAAYPCIVDHRGVRYLIYNGNGYGRTGFGVARWVCG